MGSLNPTILARKLLQARIMRDSYSFNRVAQVPDGGGGYTDGATTAHSGPCQFSKNAGKTEQGDRLQQRGDYSIKVPVDADILPTDQPIILGRTFKVVWTPPVDAFAGYRLIGLQEVGSGA